jgi:hypothetical protein
VACIGFIYVPSHTKTNVLANCVGVVSLLPNFNSQFGINYELGKPVLYQSVQVNVYFFIQEKVGIAG